MHVLTDIEPKEAILSTTPSLGKLQKRWSSSGRINERLAGEQIWRDVKVGEFFSQDDVEMNHIRYSGGR